RLQLHRVEMPPLARDAAIVDRAGLPALGAGNLRSCPHRKIKGDLVRGLVQRHLRHLPVMSKSEDRLEKLLACLFAHEASSTQNAGAFKSGPTQIDEEPNRVHGRRSNRLATDPYPWRPAFPRGCR